MPYYGGSSGDSWQIIDSDGDTLIRVENPEGADNDQIEMLVQNDRKVLITSTDGFVNGSTPMTINIGGSSTLDAKWLTRKDDSDLSVGIGTLSHSDTSGRGGVIFGGRTRGTELSPTATLDGDTVFDFAALGHDGTDFNLSGRISCVQDGAGATGSSPGSWVFAVTKPAGNNVTNFMELSHSGLTINDNSEAFGYRFETTTDEYALYNDGTNDTLAFGTSQTSLQINALTVLPKMLISREGGDSNINMILLSELTAASAGAFIVGARSNNGGAVANGDRGLVFRCDMHDGTEFLTTGAVQWVANGTIATGQVPTDLQIRCTDTAGTLFTGLTLNSSKQLQFNPDGGDDITLYPEGGMRGNRNNNSDATADLIWASASYGNMFRVDVSADKVNIGNVTQGAIAEFSDAGVRINRLNGAIDFQVDGGTNDALLSCDVSAETVKTYGGRIHKTSRYTSGPVTLGADEHEIFVNTDSAAVTINLPAGVDGTNYRIINTGSSGNNVTITPNGSELLLGANSSDTLNDGDILVITYQTTEGWW